MLQAHLTRFETSDQGTFGRLSIDGYSEKFFTGELPWRENASNVSCIPAGKYRGAWTYSARFRRMMYLVAPVLERAGIRIHPANLMGANPPYRAQLNGCISLGEKLGWIDKQKAVLLSAPALRRFETLMAGRPFELEIIDA